MNGKDWAMTMTLISENNIATSRQRHWNDGEDEVNRPQMAELSGQYRLS